MIGLVPLSTDVRRPVFRRGVVSKYTTVSLLTALILTVGAFAAEAKESPFVAHGKVTDDAGKPLEAVEVNASCGMGSLFHTGTAKTDRDGKYRLVFGPGTSIGKTK